jgi:hypothetical protein
MERKWRRESTPHLQRSRFVVFGRSPASAHRGAYRDATYGLCAATHPTPGGPVTGKTSERSVAPAIPRTGRARRGSLRKRRRARDAGEIEGRAAATAEHQVRASAAAIARRDGALPRSAAARPQRIETRQARFAFARRGTRRAGGNRARAAGDRHRGGQQAREKDHPDTVTASSCRLRSACANARASAYRSAGCSAIALSRMTLHGGEISAADF